jgi:sigma-B regulation protein RsbU (phosphoserine phosphatase)
MTLDLIPDRRKNMTGVDIKVLRNLDFLQGASEDVLRRLLAVAAERRLGPKEVVFEEGSAGRELYVVMQGQVEVAKGQGSDEVILAQLGPGQFFGEMALLEAQPRSATVRTVEPTRLLEFSGPVLHDELLQEPLLLYRATRVLMERLRDADSQMISELKDKNRELAQAYFELQQAQAALVEKERLERELELARELQDSILPRVFPHIPGFQCAARSRPAREMGGDFYDVIVLPKGHVGLVMADVSDKGMPAALYMALTRSLVHAEAKRSFSPRRVLLNVHRLLMEISQADMFVTVFYGILEPESGILRYARAGHDRPLRLQSSTGQCGFLSGEGMLLGLVGNVNLEEAEVRLPAGDVLVLYSDGITEATAPSKEMFGRDRLRQVVCDAGQLTAQELCDAIFEHADRFQAGAPQHDDMAVLVVKATGA